MKRRGVARRSPEDIAGLRKAGRVVAHMHDRIRSAIEPGVTTKELDTIARRVLDEFDATSNFLGYGDPPFPAVICTSPNEVVVHGIPGERVLEAGDIIAVDCGAIVDGWHGDAAFTAPVGEVEPRVAKLIEITEQALMAGIAQLKPGRRLGDLGYAISKTAEEAGFEVVRDYVGHGIGRRMHEPPDVPNFGRPNTGLKIMVGNVFAVEPMVNLGSRETIVLDDAWSVVTADGSWSAHFEHSVAVGPSGPEILTRL